MENKIRGSFTSHCHGCTHDHGHNEHGAGAKISVFSIIRISLSGALLIGSFFFKNMFYAYIGMIIAAFLISAYDIIWAVLKKLLKFNVRNIFDEEFLMLLAACGAFALSEYPEAVIIMLFYQIGELFQDYAVDKSRDSITKLMDIRPDFANRILDDGTTEKVDPTQILPSEKILVRAGEKIPLDGKIISGNAYVDTSAITGESVPRFVETGSQVQSGSINTNGLLKIEVTNIFSESTAAKILDLIENDDAASSRSEKFIDKFAEIYTPIVVGLAVIVACLPPLITGTLAFSTWIHRALMFLVISCPCAVVISVPLAFFGGIGSLSAKGILVKGSATMEQISKINAVAFDKTGTLTQGKLSVTDIITANGFDKKSLLNMTAIAESNSIHPVAKAIALECDPNANTDGKVLEYKEIAGRGVSANIVFDGKNHSVLAGNKKLFDEEGITIAEVTASCTHVAIDGIYAGHICVADTVKTEAYQAVAQLRKSGCMVMMLTGDAKAAAETAANELQVEYRAELLPADKTEAVRELMKEYVTAFAGDGINDTPVLSFASVGFAMGGVGSDSAIEAADAVIMDDDPRKIYTAIKAARKTLSIAKQNIYVSLIVKIMIMVLSVIGFSNMYLAIFADVGMTIVAVSNSLRTLRIKA